MFIENLFEACGYTATFLGTLLEGEILLLTSVISSKMGYFSFYGALIAAFGGAYVADYFKFVVAKNRGQYVLNKRPKLRDKVEKNTEWFAKNPTLILIFYRFFYGFTTVTILMAGLRNMTYLRFGILSAISIALWTLVLGGLGYFFAEEMLMQLEFVGDNKLLIISLLALVGLFYWYFVKRNRERHCYDLKAEESIA